MARIVNMHEAKMTLSRPVERALAGDDLVIARDGKPAVRLVPVKPDVSPRRPGRLKGRVRMAPDFDPTPAPVIGAFENGR